MLKRLQGVKLTHISINALIELALDLSRSLSSNDRFERLLATVRQAIPCDAVVLLAKQGDLLKPLAQQGLTPDSMGRRFEIDSHPRFQHICRSHNALRFAADCELPDPYDGLLLTDDHDLPIHACMGLPLMFEDTLIGVLTLDSLTPGEFDDIPERTLEIIAAMAAASLNTALTLALLERNSARAEALVNELTRPLPHQQQVDIIGQSLPIQQLKTDIQTVAQSDLTVLILGETGTGKELVAQSIHQQSRRHEGPLVYINCAALPENLIESELFGHVRGSFTGATQNRTGKFLLADGGTLFLDEIGELPLALQSKLLRALQSGEIQTLGEDTPRTVDVRVVAATNRNLADEVRDNRFRADLYHRLSVYPIQVPPLRERGSDIALLAGFFTERSRRKLGIRNLRIQPDAIQAMLHYNWPGNVRELEHLIDRASLRARSRSQRNGSNGVIDIERTDLGTLLDEPAVPVSASFTATTTATTTATSAVATTASTPYLAEANATMSLRDATEQLQRGLIMEALEQHQGNWAAAARQLQLDRANLSRLAKRLGIHVQRSVHAQPPE